MLKIEGKTFMNIQEAVQWLLDNNALPFQCSANYIANTEIGMGTIVNPSPAKVRIGSLIFFADSKVSTVTGITENGFIVSDQYNDLVDDVVYVSNVAINASGHLIITLSNGTNIDAGFIKQVVSFEINNVQHLIVNYNDGSTNDLGAIFNGDIVIGGNLTVTNHLTTKTFAQTQANYSETPYMGSGTENIYNRFEVIGNLLYVILNFKKVNNTESAITIYNLEGNITLPDTIAEKVIDFEGDSVHATKAQKANITCCKCFISDSINAQYYEEAMITLQNGLQANRLDIAFASTGISIPANSAKYFTARMVLTLL